MPGISGTARRADTNPKKRIKYRVPVECWERFAHWLASTNWSHSGLGPAPDESTSEQRRVTWLEMILLFQCQTGVRLRQYKPDLSDQEKLCRTLFTRIFKLSKCRINGQVADMKQSWFHGKFIDSVKPLIGHCRAGICRRPSVSNTLWQTVASPCLQAQHLR